MKSYIASWFIGLSLMQMAHGAVIKEIDRATGEKTVCSITVSFGSYASGTDDAAYDKIKVYVEASNEVTDAFSWVWGKEGEHSLCLKTIDKATDRIYEKLRSFIPAESKEAWTEIEQGKKKTFRTQWPK